MNAVADLGEAPGGPGPPLLWQKKNNEMMKKRRRKKRRQGKRCWQINFVSTSHKNRPPFLSSGLDPPLECSHYREEENVFKSN